MKLVREFLCEKFLEEGDPIHFMIAPHDDKRNKFRIFEVEAGKGRFENKGETF